MGVGDVKGREGEKKPGEGRPTHHKMHHHHRPVFVYVCVYVHVHVYVCVYVCVCVCIAYRHLCQNRKDLPLAPYQRLS